MDDERLRALLAPGPRERKLRNRIVFRLTGRWPWSVVDERLTRSAEVERLRRSGR